MHLLSNHYKITILALLSESDTNTYLLATLIMRVDYIMGHFLSFLCTQSHFLLVTHFHGDQGSLLTQLPLMKRTGCVASFSLLRCK